MALKGKAMVTFNGSEIYRDQRFEESRYTIVA